MFFKKSKQIKELKKELNCRYGENAHETYYMDQYHILKRENEELKFSLHSKEDLQMVISKVRKEYLITLDNELFNQYITLLKIYNRIGE